MTAPRIGLALGGGAARGLAHIPMLEVFDEMGIKPAVIAGSSIGALMGAAYASGVSAKEMRVHAEQLLSTRIDAARYVFGAKKARLRDLLALKSFGSLQIQGEKLLELAFPETVKKRVEDTLIPLKIVATDFERREERVFTSGPLVTAVAASIAIPGVILGPRIEGRIFVDGGVTNPVPFDHVRADSDLVVAIDVTGKPRPSARHYATNIELAVGSMLIMFHQIAELRRAVSPPEIYIEPPIHEFGGGDFFRAKEMFEAASKCKDQLKRSLELRINTIA
jgi:NTE family protein